MLARKPDANTVSIAKESDRGEIMELCRSDHAERGIGAFAVDKVSDLLARALDPGRNNLAVVGVVRGDCIEATIGLVVDQTWNSETDLLMCRWSYVRPEHRRGAHLKDMLAWAQNIAIEVRVPLHLDMIASRRTEGPVRMYRRHLGEPVLMTWLSEPYTIMEA